MPPTPAGAVSRSTSDAIRFAAVRAPFDGWTVVEVAGRHRERYLQSQLTSDLRQVAVGGSQLSALLDASGRLQGFFHLTRLADAVRLLVPDGAVEGSVAGLEANVVADDVHVRVLDVGPMTLVLGPAAEQLRRSLSPHDCFPVNGFGTRALAVWGDVELPFPEVTTQQLEDRRVLSGHPAWGVDASPGMLVNETALLDSAVSLTKGCFLGQETVAKVASRRGAAFAPVLLALVDAGGRRDDLVGREFAVADRRRAGVVRAVATWEERSYLQVSLWRELRIEGQRVRCVFDDRTQVDAEVRRLPLIACAPDHEMATDLFHHAVGLFTDDDEDGAIRLLKRAIAVCPGFADAYESLGVVLGRHGRHEEAIELMNRLLEVDPDSVMAHSNKSVYLNQLGRNDEAEEEARLAARKSFELERRRRQAEPEPAGSPGEGAEADRLRREQMFRRVLEIDPTDAMANLGLGQLALERGRSEEAVEHLQRALDADPDYSAAFLALGRAWEARGEAVRARETYTAGVRVAARKGDMKTASSMQERLAALGDSVPAAAD
jgi:folate-binding protein YgfZ